MIVDEHRHIATHRYWSLDVNTNIDFASKIDDKARAKKFYELMEESIRLRLMSEVPVGTSFSGGLDSSTIVCIVNKLLLGGFIDKKIIGARQKTFSAVYNDKKIDERRYMEEVLRVTGVERNFIFPDAKGLWEDVKKLIYHQDEPFGTTSMFAQWEVMKLASNKVTVLLDGQGGDELLAGYVYYLLDYFIELWRARKLPRLLVELIMALDFIPQILRSARIRREAIRLMRALLNADFCDKVIADSGLEALEEGKHKSLAGRLHSSITRDHIPRLLRYEDKSSMAFSIEARVPFLDHRLVEYVFSLPINYRIRNGWLKFILRDAMKGILPERIRLRRSKIGYATPESQWFKELRNEINAVFMSEQFRTRGYFNADKVLNKFNAYCDGKLHEALSPLFWRILNLELWFEIFIDEQKGQI
jgi:asparagine synthase (glutamine-hydrolysing)